MKSNIVSFIRLNSGCLGCGACNNVCPVDAIKMIGDFNGYYIPTIDEQKCILCGKCTDVCPFVNRKKIQHFDYSDVVAFAAWAPMEIRDKSSSGGAAPIFSEYIIKKGGTVYGAVWNEDWSCSIVAATTVDECVNQRFSKYVQSDVGLTFREVKSKLIRGENVLYFGVPCQIAGLNNFLGELVHSEKLITVELVCSHAPSSQYFKKYILEKKQDIETITFRSKRDFGWTCDGHVIQMKDGSKEKCTLSTDSYQAAYHGLIMRRNICEECMYADFPRQGDITLGDFWGIGSEDPSWDDGMGTSLIVANSQKGISFIQSVSKNFVRIQEVPVEWVRNKGNRIGGDGRKGHKNAHYFSRIVKNNSFEKAVSDALCSKHDVGIVCYSNRNYGNNLTNFALYYFFNKLGCSALMINTPKDSVVNQEIYFGEGFLNSPYYEEDLSERLKEVDYIKYNDICDFFCVGSDQLFRDNFVEGMGNIQLLKFVYSYKYKFSYGTSFGDAKYESNNALKYKMTYLLSRFQGLSVRELSGKEILKDKFEIENVDHVIDPVFLVDYGVYQKMADDGSSRCYEANSYIGAYFLDMDNIKQKVLLEISAAQNMKEYVILDRETYAYKSYQGQLNVMDDPKVEEWLALIRGAKIFVTDSFHGVCFALIFQKDFYVLFDKDNWRGIDRIAELLEEIGLQDRLIIIGEDNKMPTIPIDYKKVNSVIQAKVNKSEKWLQKRVEDAKTFKGKASEYDVFLEDEYKNKALIQKNVEGMLALKTDMLLSKNSFWHKQGEIFSNMDKVIVGFGIGNCLKRNIEKIMKGCQLTYLSDNNPDKWDKEFYGIKCIPPRQIAGFSDVYVIIFLDDVGMAFEIAKQLMRMEVFSFDHVNNLLSEAEK